MKHVVFLLLSLVLTATAAAAPVLSFNGAEAVVTLPAGHRVLWLATVNSQRVATIAADTDGDGEVRFTPPNSSVAVFDLETAEWALGVGVTAHVTIEGQLAGIMPAMGPSGEITVTHGENLLWLRPGVGVWKPPATWTQLVPDAGEWLFADMATYQPIGTSPATPSHVQQGDWLFSFESRSLWLNEVDLELRDYPGTFRISRRESKQTEGNVATFTIIRLAGTTGTVTTSCKAAGGNAVPGIDYASAAEQPLTFGPGEFFKQCSFPLLDDGLYNDAERFLWVEMTPPSPGDSSSAYRYHQFEIVDDDPVPVLSFGDVPDAVTEGDVDWALGVPFSVTGNFRGSIEARLVEGYSSSGPVATLTPSETSKTLPLAIDANDDPQLARTLTVKLIPTSRVSRIQPVTRTITLLDDDNPALTMTDASAIESTLKATLKVTPSRWPASPATITWSTADGTAKAGEDYWVASGTTNVGDSIAITILEDYVDEGPETFYVDITAFTGPIQPPARTRYEITIVDDDTAPPAVTLTPLTAPEPVLIGVTDLTMPVQLATAMPAVVRVLIGTGGGNATEDVDYRRFSTALTFEPGETVKNVPIRLLGDLRDEPDETIVVVAQDFAHRTLGTTTITIVDDDDTGVLSVGDVQVTETTGPNATATFTLTLSAPFDASCTVQYQTLEGSAKSGLDFANTSGTLTFNPGETTKQVSVTVFGDAASEADEQFALHLFNFTSYKNWLSLALARDRAFATIIDNDATVAIPGVTIGDITVTETDGASEAQFTVKLTRMAEQTASLAFETVPLTATASADFTPVSGVVTFQPGDRTAVITVPITGDDTHEESEAFLLRIHSGQQLFITDVEAVCQIHDDDPERTKRRSARH